MNKTTKTYLLPTTIGLALGVLSTLPGHVSPLANHWLGLPILGHFFGYSIGLLIVCYINRKQVKKSWLLGVLTIMIANLTYYLLPVALNPFIDTIHLGTMGHMVQGFIMWTVIAMVLACIFVMSLKIWQRGKTLWLRRVAGLVPVLVLLYALYLDRIVIMMRKADGAFGVYGEEYLASERFTADLYWVTIGVVISIVIGAYLWKKTPRTISEQCFVESR